MATKSKYEENYTTVYEATVNQVAKDRHEIANLSFPELREEDFPPAIDDKNPYKDALVAQYLAIREYEYNLVVQNESMKAFNEAYGNNQKQNTRCENQQSWDGYPQTKVDSCFNRTQHIAQTSDGYVPGSWCCAISATSMTAQISGKMGYDGKDNLIQPKSRLFDGKHVGPKNNPGAAQFLNQLDSIPPEYRIPNKNEKLNGQTLNQAIKQGLVKVGDAFSVKTGEGTQTSTGCHAMVLTDIQYAADGKTIVSYTLQGNNPPTLKQVDAQKPDYYGSRKLVCVTKTNQWLKDQDAQKINGMSTEKLQEEIAAARQRVSATIDEMQTMEAEYAKNKRYGKPPVRPCKKIDANGKSYIKNDAIGKTDGFGAHYNEAAEALHQRAENLRDEQILQQLEKENAEREAALKKREAETKKKEDEYEREKIDFLKAHPEKDEEIKQKDKERAENTGTPENPEPTEIPPVTDSQDIEERKRNAMARKEALAKKEEELDDRDYNVSDRSSELLLIRQETPLTKEEKKAKKNQKDSKKVIAQNEQQRAKLKASMKKGEIEADDMATGEKVAPEAQAVITEEDEKKKALAHAEGRGAFKGARADAKVDEHTAIQEISQPQRTSAQTKEQTTVQATPASDKKQEEGETWEMTQDGKLIKVTKDKTKPKTEIGVNELIERMRQR